MGESRTEDDGEKGWWAVSRVVSEPPTRFPNPRRNPRGRACAAPTSTPRPAGRCTHNRVHNSPLDEVSGTREPTPKVSTTGRARRDRSRATRRQPGVARAGRRRWLPTRTPWKMFVLQEDVRTTNSPLLHVDHGATRAEGPEPARYRRHQLRDPRHQRTS
jgi:hypothetical protein